MEAFLRLFDGLPRQGPGSDETTRRALALCGELPAELRIIDLGCGLGRSSLVLARETGGTVDAVDLHQPYLDELREAAVKAGLGQRVTTICASMDEVEARSELYHLVWSEGAAYLVGFEYALSRWAGLLGKGGRIAVTEATWLKSERPVQAMQFWAEAYPDMQDVRGNLKALRRQGFEPIEHFTLPAEDWTAEYYSGLEANIESLRAEASRDEELAEVITATEREIEMFRRYGDSYGYVFYLARKTAG